MAMQEQKQAAGYPMQGTGPNGVGYGQARESRYDDGSMLHPAYNNPEYAK